jgi:copper chaperone CopZ
MKKVFHIPDMHCNACVMRLEGLEDELPGIRRVSASYHRQEMEVEWDENRLEEAQIIHAVEQKGYTVSQK